MSASDGQPWAVMLLGDEFTQTGRSRQCFVTKSNIRLEPTSSLERPKTGRKVAKWQNSIIKNLPEMSHDS